MEDLICLGCRKVFPSQKCLSGHEARCEADKLLDADVYKSQRRLEKGRKKHRKTRAQDETRSLERRQRNTSPEADMQMDLGDDHVNPEYGDVAGPSGYVPEPEPPVPTPDAPAVVSARSGQRIRMPALLGNSPRSHAPDQSSGARMTLKSPYRPASEDIPHQPPLVPYQTAPDEMGLFRIYAARPTLIPKGDAGLDAAIDAPTLDCNLDLESSQVVTGLPSPEIGPKDIFFFSPFSSPTAGLLMCWQYSGVNSKSNVEMKHLTRNFLDDNEYKREDAQIYYDVCEKRLISAYLKDSTNPFRAKNGWRESTVQICLPKEKMKWASEDEAPVLEIPGVYHHSLTDVITSVFQDSVASTFHMTPFQQWWKVSEECTVNVYSEAYSSPAFSEAYEEVNSLPREPDDNLNSKYTRGKPTASACHHVVYIPSIPSDFQDTYFNIFANASSTDVYTHSRALIFKQGASINSQRIQNILNEESLVPTRNAFSEHLTEYLFNFFVLFVVDLLHKFDLGVWKAIFTHLMRILFAAGGAAVQELNWSPFANFSALCANIITQRNFRTSTLPMDNSQAALASKQLGPSHTVVEITT
ncbi:hypothetical protein DFJ58DRAFT_841220 [Suillus subalutaceus]|uniref:uncharacterized protein n=1 Tax=Suillus subalutaceus TaxID=48586 RepID=UPI001B875066|nr:uncharacterized protein DFJ58DRAFT_841220 [Suillus subalutaceus]KAG1855214.1 hypothetical protein DFJ58DRAFT_841220 [Suillus subalutaceus]